MGEKRRVGWLWMKDSPIALGSWRRAQSSAWTGGVGRSARWSVCGENKETTGQKFNPVGFVWRRILRTLCLSRARSTSWLKEVQTHTIRRFSNEDSRGKYRTVNILPEVALICSECVVARINTYQSLGSHDFSNPHRSVSYSCGLAQCRSGRVVFIEKIRVDP